MPLVFRTETARTPCESIVCPANKGFTNALRGLSQPRIAIQYKSALVNTAGQTAKGSHMTFKSAMIGLALVASAISAQATSTFSLTASPLALTGSGFFRAVGMTGSFTASVQDQTGWTAIGDPEWGAVQSLTLPWGPGVSLTSANNVSAKVTVPGGLTVSTQDQGGFAQAEQDFTLQILLAAHSTVTVSWDVALSGSNSGLSSGTFDLLGTVTLGDTVQTSPYSLAFAGTESSGSGFASSPTPRSITFTNASNSNLLTAYHSNIKISTRDVIPSPVPEADLAWMSLAGLAVVGVARARRRG